MQKINYATLCANGFVVTAQTALTGDCLATVYCSYAPALSVVLVFPRTDPAMPVDTYIDTHITAEQAIALSDIMSKAHAIRMSMYAEPFEVAYARLRGLPAKMPDLFANRELRGVYIYITNDEERFHELVKLCSGNDRVEVTIKFFSNDPEKVVLHDASTLPISPSGAMLTPAGVKAAWEVISANAVF